MAIMAYCKNKSLYFFAESYKFRRSFLLNAYDILQEHVKVDRIEPINYELLCSTVDFTDPKYIQLVCTDLRMFATA
jgi:translation initiation factor 2B subunit (eIF-2B alpha/beta/delta family)